MFNGCSVNSFISSLAIAFAMRPVKTLNKKHKKLFHLIFKLPKNTVVQLWLSGSEYVPKVTQRNFSVIFSSCWYIDQVKPGSWWHAFYNCDPEGPSTYEISLYIWSLLILRRLRVNIWTIISYLDFLDIICWVINQQLLSEEKNLYILASKFEYVATSFYRALLQMEINTV